VEVVLGQFYLLATLIRILPGMTMAWFFRVPISFVYLFYTNKPYEENSLFIIRDGSIHAMGTGKAKSRKKPENKIIPVRLKITLLIVSSQ